MTDAQVERYSRQIILPEVGARGQERLLAAGVAVSGTGAAAVGAVSLLGRAGVGTIDAPATVAAPSELPPECRIGAVDRPDVVLDLTGDAPGSAARGRRAQAAGVPFVRGTLDGTTVIVTTLAGRPCIACVAPDDAEPARALDPLAVPAALALGALAAAEVLRVLLLPRDGRRTTLDIASGTCRAVPLEATGGCPLCGANA